MVSAPDQGKPAARPGRKADGSVQIPRRADGRAAERATRFLLGPRDTLTTSFASDKSKPAETPGRKATGLLPPARSRDGRRAANTATITREQHMKRFIKAQPHRDARAGGAVPGAGRRSAGRPAGAGGLAPRPRRLRQGRRFPRPDPGRQAGAGPLPVGLVVRHPQGERRPHPAAGGDPEIAGHGHHPPPALPPGRRRARPRAPPARRRRPAVRHPPVLGRRGQEV